MNEMVQILEGLNDVRACIPCQRRGGALAGPGDAEASPGSPLAPVAAAAALFAAGVFLDRLRSRRARIRR